MVRVSAPVDGMSARSRIWLFGLTLLSFGLGALCYRLLAGRELGIAWLGPHWLLSAPERLALCACLPLLAAASWLGLSDHAPLQRALSLGARAALLGCLSLALSRPLLTRTTTRVSVVLAADVSDSLGPAARARQRAFIERACAAAAPDACKLLEFARSARPLRSAAQLDRSGEPDPGFRAETNLQAALQLAYGMHEDGHARRVVVLSDGKQTAGDLALEATRAAQLGIELDYLAISDPPPEEVGVSALVLPPLIEVGRAFRVRAELFASVRSALRVRLLQGDSLLAERELELAPGDTPLEFPALVRVSGPVEYRLELTPRGADRFADNNRASAAGFAHGRARVLWVDGEPAQLSAASDALQQHAFEVETRGPSSMPRTAAELAGYDFFILSDVAADQLPQGSLGLIERYLRERGAGFMMVGGDRSFGLGGYQHTPLAKLLPVQMAGEVHRDEHSLALALLIDCSGSMAGAKIDLAKEAARASVEVLADEDLIEVVGFAGEPSRQVRMQSARNRMGVMQNIARLVAQGGTQLFPALDLAYQDLALARARIKHVILLTDGQTQESGIPEIIQTMRSENITVSAVGLGRDVNRELLQTAAGMGGGRAYFTDDPRNVPRIFVHETTIQKRNDAVERPTRMRVREPAAFLKGIDIDRAPALRGYVATQAKPHPAQVLLESESGEPILARVRVGLGYALAFTPDLKARWSADFMRWPEFANFFSQLIREHLRNSEGDELPMHVDVEAGLAHVSIDAVGSDDRFIHDLTSRVDLLDAHSVSARSVQLREVAPGRYEGSLPLPGFGAFALRATHSLAGVALGESHAQAQNPYPPEYRPEPPNLELLERAAALTGGRALRDGRDAWRPARKPVTIREELWPYAIWLALLLFLTDLWLRRVRLFDRGFDRPERLTPDAASGRVW
jgi:Ca-activated chloride channel homolog